jgi:hypothetical protein
MIRVWVLALSAARFQTEALPFPHLPRMPLAHDFCVGSRGRHAHLVADAAGLPQKAIVAFEPQRIGSNVPMRHSDIIQLFVRNSI